MSLAAETAAAPGETAHGSASNGAARPQATGAAARGVKAAIRPRDARQARFAQSFAQVIAVLMRDANFRKMRLADLEWLVLPPVMAGQFNLAQAPARFGRLEGKGEGKDAGREGGVLVPVAVALWARVSDAIDKTLSENLDKPVRLGPADWASGDNIWLIAVAGDQRAMPKFIEELSKNEFAGQRVKMRVRGPGNTVAVKTLGRPAEAETEDIVSD
jgi:cytolysin-activating lysine-acyltransferase